MDTIHIEGRDYTAIEVVARQTGYSREYLRKIAKAGKVNAVKVGGLWFVHMPSLEAYRAGDGKRKPKK